MQRRYQKAAPVAHRADGAILIETILALGVLLTLLWGLMQFGQFLSQVIWLQQSIYQVASSAAETADSEPARVARARETLVRLIRLHNDPAFHAQDSVWRNSPLEIDANSLVVTFQPGANFALDSRDQMVVAQVEGALRPLGRMISIPIRSTFTVPMIQFVGANTNPDDLKEFRSPTIKFDCCGKRCGARGLPACPDRHCYECPPPGDIDDCYFNSNSCLP